MLVIMGKKKICCIYRIISPTGKIYIGQTIDFELRIKHYQKLRCKNQTKLYYSLNKHGFKNHAIGIVRECSHEELNKFEKYYIDLWNTFNSKFGLNLRDGGDGHGKMSDESKKKMSLSRIGKKLSETTRNKLLLRDANGNIMSEEEKRKRRKQLYKIYESQNKDKSIIRKKKWYNLNKKTQSEREKKWRNDNRKRVREFNKKYWENNKEVILSNRKKRRQKQK